ncbi:MAG: Spx/MgsR family RNA polymerase-binding regulatory protein [Gammaproteobacteria bacterium AqS3]|nr:Spx/MgsR family RNA polymerase-binding regulatory protein [Gammaproteobacteria bacterium AqS3]
MQLYGIPNCDRVRQARRWLEQAGFKFEFIDLRRQPPSAETLEGWLAQIPPEQLINRLSPTWRRLKPRQRIGYTPQHWIRLLLKHPILLRRPLLVRPDGTLICRFDPSEHGAGLTR